MNWYEFFWILGIFFAGWLCYRTIQGRPDQFTAKAALKTMNTLGFLALGLIAFIGICIMLLKAN
jgi:prolipoprotein diacylglyceryltransferase|tara:strand:- start:484 stop:675 length:192 start_codon:yes stop_codon:yes gene_type:complete